MKKNMTLLIGIPAYNEEKTISDVIKSIPRKIKSINKMDILVVDDGSSDKTSLVAASSKIYIIKHIMNRGLGGSLKTIFEFAIKYNYDFLVTIDADGQHDGKDIPNLLTPVINSKKDVMIGTRWKKDYVPFTRYIVNLIANFLTYLLFDIYGSDTQSGLRALSRKAFKMIKISSEGMEVSSEIFKYINKNKLRMGEIPIKPVYTSYSKFKGQRLDNAPEVLFRLLLRVLE